MQQATAVLHSPPVVWAPQGHGYQELYVLLDLDLGQQLSGRMLASYVQGLGFITKERKSFTGSPRRKLPLSPA